MFRLHRPRRGEHTSQRGYNMVMLAVTITVMNIMVAAVLPLWSAAVKRDREEELIFRGLQYAEAIRVYQVRKGALPTQLKDLLEMKPRSIRQLWTNPMSEDGNWGVILQTGIGGGGGQDATQRPPQQSPTRPGVGGDPGSEQGPGGQQPPGGPNACFPVSEESQVRGPIRGVCVPNGEDTFKTFFGANNTGDWIFTVDLLQAAPVGGDPNLGAPQVVNASTLGRPFPPGIQLPGTGNALGGQPPGGLPPGGQPPGGQPPGGTNRPADQPGRPPNNPGGPPPGRDLGGGS